MHIPGLIKEQKILYTLSEAHRLRWPSLTDKQHDGNKASRHVIAAIAVLMRFHQAGSWFACCLMESTSGRYVCKIKEMAEGRARR